VADKTDSFACIHEFVHGLVAVHQLGEVSHPIELAHNPSTAKEEHNTL
jgi:hypothetical protein